MTTLGVGEVIHVEGDTTPCAACPHLRQTHRYVVVSDTQMAPNGCDGIRGPCPCPKFQRSDRPAPPTREETWARYPNDAASILKASDSPSTRCRQPLCQAPIWWGLTAANNRRCPFDIQPDGERTGTSHWRTCKDRPQQEKSTRRSRA